jgi:hypothetical protein
MRFGRNTTICSDDKIMWKMGGIAVWPKSLLSRPSKAGRFGQMIHGSFDLAN